MLSFWVMCEDDTEHGSILADTQREAEKVLFEGILKDEYPVDAFLVEELIDEDQIQEYQPIEDEDILEIDEVFP